MIYEDENLLVVDKPAGTTVDDLSKKLKEDFSVLEKLDRYGLVHRLDKKTSGVLIFSKNQNTLDYLKTEFKERRVKKIYLLLTWKRMNRDEGEIVTSMRRSPKDRRKHQSYPKEEKGRLAKASYKVLEKFKNYSLIEARPETGRRHQIRSQFAYIGHPVVGDDLYRFSDQVDPELDRYFLHAKSVRIQTPSGIKEFVSDLPEELKEIIKDLRCQENY